MDCPSCGKSDIRRSHSSNWRDSVQRVLGRQAYRCRKCRRRFYYPAVGEPTAHNTARAQQKRPGGKVKDFRKRKRLLRRIIAVAVFVAMFSLFGLFLHHISVDHPPQSNAQDVGSPNE
jgi:hypothetical protein